MPRISAEQLAHILQQMGGGDDDDDRDGNAEDAPKERAIHSLMGFWERIRAPRDFGEGDLVVLKAGVVGYKVPTRRRPGIVIDIGDQAQTKLTDKGDLDLRENVLVGVIDGEDRKVLIFKMDERFLMKHVEAQTMRDEIYGTVGVMLDHAQAKDRAG